MHGEDGGRHVDDTSDMVTCGACEVIEGEDVVSEGHHDLVIVGQEDDVCHPRQSSSINLAGLKYIEHTYVRRYLGILSAIIIPCATLWDRYT